MHTHVCDCSCLFGHIWRTEEDAGCPWILSSPCLQRCCYRRTRSGPPFYVLGSWCLVKEFPYPLSHLSNPYKHIFPHQYSKELVTAGIPLFAWTNSNAISQFSTVDQFMVHVLYMMPSMCVLNCYIRSWSHPIINVLRERFATLSFCSLGCNLLWLSFSPPEIRSLWHPLLRIPWNPVNKSEALNYQH